MDCLKINLEFCKLVHNITFGGHFHVIYFLWKVTWNSKKYVFVVCLLLTGCYFSVGKYRRHLDQHNTMKIFFWRVCDRTRFSWASQQNTVKNFKNCICPWVCQPKIKYWTSTLNGDPKTTFRSKIEVPLQKNPVILNNINVKIPFKLDMKSDIFYQLKSNSTKIRTN